MLSGKFPIISQLNYCLPAGGRGASVSACAGLTNQLLSLWVDPSIALDKTLTQQLQAEFQNFVVINKIRNKKKIKNSSLCTRWQHQLTAV